MSFKKVNFIFFVLFCFFQESVPVACWMFFMVACELPPELLSPEKTELPREEGGGICLAGQGCAATVWQPLSWAGLNFGFGHRHQTSSCT